MINAYYTTGKTITFEEFKEQTIMRMPKTEQAEVARIVKLLKTMQRQGQFDEIETLYRLIRLMVRPEDDGELGRQLGYLLRMHHKRHVGAERDAFSYLIQKIAVDLPCVK